MKIWKNAVLFYLGGMLYMGLELLWRGWSHGSMFLVGGGCFLLLGAIRTGFPHLPLFMQAVMGACTVTAVEFFSGLVINRLLRLGVWDYSSQPYNLLGQVCVGYFFLWFWVSGAGVLLTAAVRQWLFGESPSLSG